MSEQYVNLAASLTAGAIDNSTDPVTFSVTAGDGALFPATINGSFRVVVSNADGTNAEVMLCTSRSTDSLTCARAANATGESPVPTKLSHAAGSIVSHDLTSGAMNQIRQDLSRPLFSGALPADGRKGDILWPTDDVVLSIHDGSAFQPAGLQFSRRGNQASQSWSWLNQTGASVTTRAQSIVLAGTGGSGANAQCRVATAPATPYTIVATYIPMVPNANFAHAGILFSDGTKLSAVGLISDSIGIGKITHLTANHYNTASSGAGGLGLSFDQYTANGYPITLLLQDDGVNRKFGYSPDGGVYIQSLVSEGRTNFLTATQVGFYVDTNGSTAATFMVLVNWAVVASALF